MKERRVYAIRVSYLLSVRCVRFLPYERVRPGARGRNRIPSRARASAAFPTKLTHVRKNVLAQQYSEARP